ncbi:hypothetical protein [Bdellovibrio sp. HCB337]|uniref:hypothetical protein n=1 Tax=Bdellovibrio sp. HCB337 TaxID=3394358 RepID=UPI0039A6B4CF
MKTKAISLTVAGVMAFQSSAFANISRTADIGNQAISTAKQSNQELKAQVLAFDEALAQAESDIVNKEKNDSVSNAITLGGAAVGVALGALSVMSEKRMLGSFYLGTNALILTFATAVGASAISNVSGLLTVNQPTAADIDKAAEELNKTQAELEKVIASSETPAQAEMLARLNEELKETKSALAAYKQDGSDLTRNRTMVRLAQFSGTVVAFASLIGGSKVSNPLVKNVLKSTFILGTVASAGGQLASIVTGMQSADTENVLKEIRETRKAVRTALAGL